MKKVLFGIFIFALFNVAFGQKEKVLEAPYLPINEDTKLVTYQDVVTEKASPQELYDRAMIWIKEYYKNTNEVIKSSDREKGIINIRSSVRIYFKKEGGVSTFRNIVYYNFKLECRQDRYRYTITDFKENNAAGSTIETWFNRESPRWDPSYYDFLTQVDEQVRVLIEKLGEGMLPKVEKVDEW